MTTQAGEGAITIWAANYPELFEKHQKNQPPKKLGKSDEYIRIKTYADFLKQVRTELMEGKSFVFIIGDMITRGGGSLRLRFLHECEHLYFRFALSSGGL